MTKIKTAQSVKGRDGWRFILRDPGQHLRIKDYAPVNLSRAIRGSGPRNQGDKSRYDSASHEKKRKRILNDALRELKEGRFIYADVFVKLCEYHGVKLPLKVYYKCMYMNELDLSIKVIRHKNQRGDYNRKRFDGIFAAIQELIAATLE